MSLKLLKFSAQWCGPCKNQEKELKEHPIDIDIQEINVDSTSSEDIELIRKYDIMSIPNMVIIDDQTGIAQERFIGYTSSNKIKEAIAKIQEDI